MTEEIAALLSSLEATEQLLVTGLKVHRGRLEGHDVLLAQSGVGKVNAAASAQLLSSFSPRALIFTGVAGAADPELRTGDIVVAVDAVQHDVDVTALGYEPGRVPGEPLTWNSSARLLELALSAAERLAEGDAPLFEGVTVVGGRIASGDQFVADPAKVLELRERFGASCVEMEGAAVAQVCARADIPFVIVRSISDSADLDAGMSFREFTDLAAGRAKLLVRAMLQRLGTDSIEPV